MQDPNSSSSLVKLGTDYGQTPFLHTKLIINWYGQTPFRAEILKLETTFDTLQTIMCTSKIERKHKGGAQIYT